MSTASVVSVPRAKLRRATAADAAALAALRNELAADFLSPVPATVEKTLELLDGSYTCVLEVNGAVFASFALTPRPTVGRECEFGRFMVTKQAQGLGHGRRMLLHAITVARQARVTCLYLRAKPDSVACGLYRDLGFDVKWVRMELQLD